MAWHMLARSDPITAFDKSLLRNRPRLHTCQSIVPQQKINLVISTYSFDKSLERSLSVKMYNISIAIAYQNVKSEWDRRFRPAC